ncbi:MAG: hypothetical protein OXU48_01895, partial [candidate division Zixibacteria bacterium]|nr:hypothetical protein [candidate division Zixibacteria bacterium]
VHFSGIMRRDLAMPTPFCIDELGLEAFLSSVLSDGKYSEHDRPLTFGFKARHREGQRCVK